MKLYSNSISASLASHKLNNGPNVTCSKINYILKNMAFNEPVKVKQLLIFIIIGYINALFLLVIYFSMVNKRHKAETYKIHPFLLKFQRHNEATDLVLLEIILTQEVHLLTFYTSKSYNFVFGSLGSGPGDCNQHQDLGFLLGSQSQKTRTYKNS